VIVMATLPPISFGSGKFGTPFLRMHAENFNAWAMKSFDWAAVGAAGANDLQAFCAAKNCAEFGFTPLPPGPPLKTKSPFASGPGKLGTPFLRMHWEYSTALWYVEPPVALWFAVAPAVVGVVVPT
jgi:hypothetical protein